MIYEYVCKEHGTFECFVKSINDREVPKPCPVCNELSQFTISAASFKLEGITGDFPTAADAWEKKHYRQLKQEEKREGRKSWQT